jgi:hypothetical protein
MPLTSMELTSPPPPARVLSRALAEITLRTPGKVTASVGTNLLFTKNHYYLPDPASLPAAGQLPGEKNLSACTRISTCEQARQIERLAELGAACVDAVSRRGGFVVMRDPEGNEFCVIDHSELGSLRAVACVRQSRHGRGSRPRSRSRALSAAYSSEVLDDLGQSPVTSRSHCPAVDASDVLAWDPRRFFRPFRRRLAHQMSVRTRLAASAVTAVPAAAPPGAQSLIHLGVVKSAPGRTDVFKAVDRVGGRATQ